MSRKWIRLTAIVAEREIRQRGRSRAFAVSTIVLLLVVAAAVVIPAIVAHTAKPQRVGIVGGQTAAMTGIVREAGRLVGTGVTVVPQPSLAAGEAALRSGQLDVVLVNDSEVVVKQVSVAVFLGLGAAVGSSLAHGAAPGIVIVGAVFLVFGYAFYCTAFAAAGSLVSRQSDVGTVILPVQVPLIIAYALSYTVIYANGANLFYKVLGFFPPTAPVAMPVLYAAGDVPAWQAAISAVLVALGTVWMARTAAAIYGRSILRTGSRVRLRQVLTRGEAA